MKIGLLLVDHGSRRPEANANLAAVAELVRAEAPGTIVEVAHMELEDPSVAQGLARCVERGAAQVVVVPYFLAPGRHVTEHIPALVAAAAGALGVEARVVEALGAHRLIARLVLLRAGLCFAEDSESGGSAPG